MMIMTCHNFSFIYEHLLSLFPLKILVNFQTNKPTNPVGGCLLQFFWRGNDVMGSCIVRPSQLTNFGHLGFMDEIPMTGA